MFFKATVKRRFTTISKNCVFSSNQAERFRGGSEAIRGCLITRLEEQTPTRAKEQSQKWKRLCIYQTAKTKRFGKTTPKGVGKQGFSYTQWVGGSPRGET